MIWITGDKHGDFDEVEAFCRQHATTRDDLLIILGDTGINYYDDARATVLRQHLAQLPITLFCIHGNHEARPEQTEGYQLRPAFGGQVYCHPKYPNQLFPVDGALYQIGSQRVLVIGGAYSIDKYFRLLNRWRWFADEQPSEAIKARTEEALAAANWQVDAVFSHTCPTSCVPRHKLPPLNAPIETVDTSTEQWLETLRQRLTFKAWYAGHFHVDCELNGLTFLFHNFSLFDA